MNKPLVLAKHISADISPKKVRPVMNLVRGKDIENAKVILAFDKTKAAQIILKVLKSAEANATHNNGIKKDDLIVTDIWVGQNTPGKKPNFGARGRYSVKVSKKSNIYVGLSEVEK